MNESSISWLAGPDGRQGSTWNPTEGCEVCSPGCKNCYAMRMAGRFSGPGKPYEGLITIAKNKKAVWNAEGRLNTDALAKPLHWKRPRKVFVDSMSDLFFGVFSDSEIGAVFGVQAAASQHDYLILTKRGTRMHRWHHEVANEQHPADWCLQQARKHLSADERRFLERNLTANGSPIWYQWPLKNVWQGVSVDTRKHGLPRIDELRDIDAAVRWLSIEPLLEDLGELDLRGIHWVVVGCESGPGARDCKPEWIRNVITQCKEQNVPVHLKQAVAWDKGRHGIVAQGIGHGPGSDFHGLGFGGPVVERPYLDGKQHLEAPRVA